MSRKRSRIIAFAIIAVMAFSGASSQVFAEGVTEEGTSTEPTQAIDPTEESSTEATEPTQETEATTESTEPTTEAHKGNLDNVPNVKTLAGHQRIKITWQGVNDATQYVIMRAPAGKSFTEYATVSASKAVNGTYTYIDKNVGDGLIDSKTKKMRGGKYRYKIIAQQVINGNVVSKSDEAAATVVKNRCVRTTYVAVTLRVGKSLTSHDYEHKTRYFSAGTRIYTCAFGIGKYIFIYGDNMYYLTRISTKNQSTNYSKTPYSKDVAEYFVNSRGNKSKTKKLIWVSVYTQRLYIFKGSKGNWKLINGNKGWTVCTGKSSTPTIRTIDPKGKKLDSGRMISKQKDICQKIRYRHNIPYWSCFSTFNAIHGKKSYWNINGKPRSGGCVRNTNDHGKWIYENCPKGTTVILF